jgi:hypothetical protein
MEQTPVEGMCRNLTSSEITQRFSPGNMEYILANPGLAITTDKSPTVIEVKKTFGDEFFKGWLLQQLYALFLTSKERDMSLIKTIETFATYFASELNRFKLSEIMLYLARYKAGKYDASYTSFDEKRIGYCFFHQFQEERNNELEKEYRRKSMEESLKRASLPDSVPRGYTSLSWYNELKKRERNGDEEAKRLLEPPSL